MANQPTIVSAMPLEQRITILFFIAEDNLPFAVADNFGKLCKVMFPDSKIAEGIACGRTKSTAIAILPALQALVEGSFSIDQEYRLLCPEFIRVHFFHIIG